MVNALIAEELGAGALRVAEGAGDAGVESRLFAAAYARDLVTPVSAELAKTEARITAETRAAIESGPYTDVARMSAALNGLHQLGLEPDLRGIYGGVPTAYLGRDAQALGGFDTIAQSLTADRFTEYPLNGAGLKLETQTRPGLHMYVAGDQVSMYPKFVLRANLLFRKIGVK